MIKNKVLLRAPLLTNSGYGIHSRQVFDWLYGREDIELIVECMQWGRTPWILDESYENGLIGKIMECSKPFNKEEIDVSFQVQLPDEWDENLGRIKIGVTALVETDRCSAVWVEKCNKMDQVIVPSTFTKNVLKRSGPVLTPITVIPEWYNTNLTNQSQISKTLNDERFSQINNEFNILIIGTLTSQIPQDDRKNLVNTIKWVSEEFAGSEEVSIILKTNFGKGTTADKFLCKTYLKRLKVELGLSKFPKIKLIHGNMKSQEVAALFNHPKIKMYVTGTRGEGYGLPIIEAAASGKPIVATGWSGHLQFLDREKFGCVDYSLVEISDTRTDNRIFEKGFRWAEPDESSFKREIRKVYTDYATAKNEAREMMKSVRMNFNRSEIKKQYDNLFKGYAKK